MTGRAQPILVAMSRTRVASTSIAAVTLAETIRNEFGIEVDPPLVAAGDAVGVLTRSTAPATGPATRP